MRKKINIDEAGKHMRLYFIIGLLGEPEDNIEWGFIVLQRIIAPFFPFILFLPLSRHLEIKNEGNYERQ
ncbi:MAG: hypothetical protein HON76_11720 [Candidatus Scalindua sp.]|nr:hypothetical protein [Candidatus Scalindua sp.]MBT5307332.1 hypothetical protein [Candidatus Scalindua sp.]MBT6225990.1 hypothetical protein [Candidatus Scalindua sp.]MBT6563180.1 hypothetical protein [Candidatus Scalindua sp.]MBT7212488.1 hypothetical protein [Candidatus Scalindua sp.]